MNAIRAIEGTKTENKIDNTRSSNIEHEKGTSRTLNSYNRRLSDIIERLVNRKILLSDLILKDKNEP